MTDQPETGVVRRTLRRVVPIATVNVRAGVAITLVVLEDFSDGFDVRGWLVVPKTHPARDQQDARDRALQARLLERAVEARQGKSSNVMPMVFVSESEARAAGLHSLMPNLSVTVRDDRGNVYRMPQHGSGMSGGGEFRLEFMCQPALDQEASELRIEVHEIAWSSVPPLNDESPIWVDAGPWDIVVDLTAGRSLVQTGEAQ